MVKCIMACYTIQKRSDNPMCAYIKGYPRFIIKFKSKLQNFTNIYVCVYVCMYMYI